MLRHTLRVARVAAGAVLLALGVVLAVPGVPGPGIVLLVAGLGVLGGEFDWAHRLNVRLRSSLQRLWGTAR